MEQAILNFLFGDPALHINYAFLNFLLPPLIQWGVGKLGEQLFGGGGGSSTVSQQPLRTKEQEEATKMLLSMAGGGEYGGALGSYGLTGTEQAGQSKLRELVAAGMPKMSQLGQAEIEKLLTTDYYDPYAEKGVYKGLKRGVEKEFEESTGQMKRSMNFAGGLYSTETARQARKLAEEKGGKLSDILGSLYQRFGEQKLAGAQTAANMGAQQQQMDLERIQQAATIGAIPRMIEDQKAKEKYSEWVRARGEKLATLKTIATDQPTYGVKDYTTTYKSPFEDIINSAISNLTKNVGGYISKKIVPMTPEEQKFQTSYAGTA